MSRNEPVEIACEFIRESEKAWLINDGAREVWIAKSQISEQSKNSIVIPEWLAMEKELI